MVPIPTEFAPAERAASDLLRHQIDYFSEEFITRHLLDAVPGILAILNGQRQIVYANKAFLDVLMVREGDLVHGRRFGEALDCVNAAQTEGGCGTTEKCSTCGAVLSTLAGLSGTKDVRECRITRCLAGRMEALDLQVCATPFVYGEESFTVFAVTDISHQKRRHALERIFFHDILNVVGGIRGFAELLSSCDMENRQEICGLIRTAAEQTVEEILAQRTLLSAENGDLRVRAEALNSRAFLEHLVAIWRHHGAAENRRLVLAPELEDIVFVSDRAILGRVLGNMIKNALEAVRPGETVTVGCGREEGEIAFRVHNPGVIPRQAQLQIFQRSFSTKGPGRGLGTYSMQLLSGYLGGEVRFVTSPAEGTTFVARYPRAV